MAGVAAGTYYWIAESLEAGNPANPVSSLRRARLGNDGTLSFEDFTGAMNDLEQGLNRQNEVSGGSIEVRIKELSAPSATRVYFIVVLIICALAAVIAIALGLKKMRRK